MPDSVYLLLGHDIAIAHHERWDGSGSPDGRQGEEKAKHFDPMIVGNCERIKDETIEVHNSIQESSCNWQ